MQVDSVFELPPGLIVVPIQLAVWLPLALTVPVAGVGPVFGKAASLTADALSRTGVCTSFFAFAPYDPVIGRTHSKPMPVNKRTAPRATRAVTEAEGFRFIVG